MKIFSSPNRVSDSVNDAESRYIKIFPGNPALEILCRYLNCVGRPNMRGLFLMKISLIASDKFPVILGCLLVWVYLILSEPTQF